MTEATEALYGDCLTALDVHSAHGVEDRDTGTEERGEGGWVDIFGDGYDGLCTEDAVFGVLKDVSDPGEMRWWDGDLHPPSRVIPLTSSLTQA